MNPASLNLKAKKLEAVYVDQHYNLVVECKQGSRKAQYELYKLYSKAMFNMAMRIVSDEAEAADILQEAFVDAFKRIGRFQAGNNFRLMDEANCGKQIYQPASKA